MGNKSEILKEFLDQMKNSMLERNKKIKKRKEASEREIFILKLVKKRTLIFMGFIIFMGLIVPFGAQFFPLDWETNAAIWNSYTSIILGIVATICSLLSIYMAFYAQQQTFISNNNTVDDMNAIRKEIQELAIQMARTNQSIQDMSVGYTNRDAIKTEIVGVTNFGNSQAKFEPEKNIVSPGENNQPCKNGCEGILSECEEIK